MAEKCFDHEIIHSGFEQPRGKDMAKIMGVACDDLREVITPVELSLF